MTITADTLTAALAPVLAEHGIPGAVAMVGNRAGTIAEAAIGAKAPGGPAMPLDAQFQIASMTKAVTSVAAMQLVEQGRLSLDAPIGDLLPDVGAAQVLTGFADDGTPQLRAPKRPVTLKHLLTHTSGFGYEFMAAELVKWRETNPQVPFSRAALVTPLLADPGKAGFMAPAPIGPASPSKPLRVCRSATGSPATSSSRSAWPKPASSRRRPSAIASSRCTPACPMAA